jgi:hypothetical protein
MTETQFNTPTFNDPEPCENEECKDGFIYSNYWDYDTNESFPQKEKCPFCDDYGHKIK